jgi:lipopolysaccharide biosynthesis glycosyltransferase
MDHFIKKNQPKHSDRFLYIIKESSKGNREYNEMKKRIKEEYKRDGLDITNFDIIFKNLFYPEGMQEMNYNEMMIPMMMKNNEMMMMGWEKKKQIQLKKGLLHLNEESDRLKEYDLDFQERSGKMIVIFKNHKTKDVKEYEWGDKDLFKKVLKKVNQTLYSFQMNNEILLNIENIKSSFHKVDEYIDSNYNLLNVELHDYLKRLGEVWKRLESNEYRDEKMDLLHNKMLKNGMEKMKKMIEESDLIDSREVRPMNISDLKEKYLLLLDDRFIFLLYQYILKYVYQYLKWDPYILVKIKMLYKTLSGKVNMKRVNGDVNKVSFGLMGKIKMENKPNNLEYGLDVLDLCIICMELNEKAKIRKQDIVLSFVMHQYDQSIIYTENKYYSIREDIDKYYQNKRNMSVYLINKEKDHVVIPRYILMNEGLFYEYYEKIRFPMDGIYREDSLIVKETFYSDSSILKDYLNKVIIWKVLKEIVDKFPKFYNFFKNMDMEKRVMIETSTKKEVMNVMNHMMKGGDEKNNMFEIFEEKYSYQSAKKPTKYAYCSLLYGNNQYFLDAVTFGYSIYQSGTPFDRILICTKDVPYESRKQLSRFYNRIFVVKELEVDDRYFESKNRWYGVFNKIYAFYLDEYEKILLMDTDMLVMKNETQVSETDAIPSFCMVDEIFEKYEAPCAMVYDKNYIMTSGKRIPSKLIEEHLKEKISTLNAGVMLIKPSKSVFKDMVWKLSVKSDVKKEACKFPEEGFLNMYFKDSWTSLPTKYNFNPLFCEEMKNMREICEEMKKIREEDIAVIHYAGYKPWILLKDPFWIDLSNKNEMKTKAEKYWLNVFQEVEEYMSIRSRGVDLENVICLRDFCKWENISFKI